MNDHVAADMQRPRREETADRGAPPHGRELPQGVSPSARNRRRGWALLIFAVIAAAGYLLLRNREPGLLDASSGFLQKAFFRTEPKRAEPPAPAPVHVATVATRDVPVYLSGLGTVQATNSVTVRSRVDGQIEKVAFEEGQLVHAGDLLVQIDPAPFKAALDQATAKLAQDEANLDIAKREQARTRTLAEQGWATMELRDQRDAVVAQLTAQIEADKAAIQSAQIQLNYTTIKSPLTGQAGFRLVDAGNIIHAADPGGVLTINQLEPISVIFTEPEHQLGQIRDSLRKGPMKVLAYTPDGRTLLGEGELMLVDNQIDLASGTIRLKASFPNTDHRLWPGLSVSTRLLLTTLRNVVAVPSGAVERGPEGLYAYVVTKDNKAELRPLKVGRIEDGIAVVEDGLSPGERVVVSGQYRVRPGGMVHILPDKPESQKATGPANSEVD